MAAPNFLEFHTISIDFDVFKALTSWLESPSDTYNEVLRRLLELPPSPKTEPVSLTQAGAWKVGGVVFPPGTEFRLKHRGVVHTGHVEDGALIVNGKRFTSPSPAAVSITGNSVNGWILWECKRPGSAWVLMDSLRKK